MNNNCPHLWNLAEFQGEMSSFKKTSHYFFIRPENQFDIYELGNGRYTIIPKSLIPEFKSDTKYYYIKEGGTGNIIFATEKNGKIKEDIKTALNARKEAMKLALSYNGEKKSDRKLTITSARYCQFFNPRYGIRKLTNKLRAIHEKPVLSFCLLFYPLVFFLALLLSVVVPEIVSRPGEFWVFITTLYIILYITSVFLHKYDNLLAVKQLRSSNNIPPSETEIKEWLEKVKNG